MSKVERFDAIKISLASPQEISLWSYGEITKPETINYRTQRPEKDGLFCEKIFGPTKDYECYCGKYKRIRYKGIICDKCGVEVTKSSVRRERMGHILLATPVAHIWFFRGVPSRVGLLLGKPMQDVERIVYFVSYIVISVDEVAKKKILQDVEEEFKRKNKEKNNKKEQEELKKIRDETVQEIKDLKEGVVISENGYRRFSLKYGSIFKAGTGAEALREIFEKMDLKKLEKELESKHKESSQENKKKIRQRLSLVRKFIDSEIRPEWIFLTNLPVIPPDLRPMVQLDGGRYASSDLNDLYRRVINRNNRLKYLKEIDAPEIIQRNEKRMLQEAVDALIDNSSRRKPQQTTASTGGKRELKSLADMLKGKQGRFRQNLLGKRVDYSGRSVIVVGPELKLDEVGIPKKMALELFKPFIIHKIIERGLAHNVRGAGILISEEREEVWEILEEIIDGKYLLLNRAPTLHRLSVQAFKPLLIEGNALQIHPLVCPAFNADFDGDQMAVFLPLSKRAQREASDLMVSTKGVLKPATGRPIAIPRQEMILGCYFLTKVKPGLKGEGKIFASPTQAKIAFDFGEIDSQAKIKILKDCDYFKQRKIECNEKFIETSVGRILFNDILPKDFPYQNDLKDSRKIQSLITVLIEKYPHERAIKFLDSIKNLGFEASTSSCITWGIDDLIVPEKKQEVLGKSEKEEIEIRKQYMQGFLSDRERKDKIIEIWQRAKDEISEEVLNSISKDGSVFYIIDSGARGSWAQPFQMAGMKGLVANPAGETIELPVKKSYYEGLTTLEYFISTHGARKGTVDTALRTSSAGYLTRRLVDVAHELIVKEKDCGDRKGIIIQKKGFEELDQDLFQKLLGRIVLEDIKNKKGKVLLKKGEIIDENKLREIENEDIESFNVRSPLSCKCLKGICQKCYGMDLTTHQLVKLGEAVGVVAAQAIGEPGTQLTMKTFHTGGVTGVGDITLGLPRVEEIFEARSPKGEAPIFEEPGRVLKIKKERTETIIEVKTEKKKKKEYKIPAKVDTLIKEGEMVVPGQAIIEGRIDIKKLFKAAGQEKAQKYILNEVQKIYTEEGVSIHDKHVETIIRQLFSRVKIVKVGDSNFAKGEVISRARLAEVNNKIKRENGEEAKEKPVLLGITKVALSTDSFLSAASFQETSRVLIKAAIEGREDNLEGLKENVIIGKLVPSGTGFIINDKDNKEK